MVLDSGEVSQYLEETLASDHFNMNSFFILKI